MAALIPYAQQKQSLSTAYLLALALDAVAPTALMWIALAAYAAYVINAAQFLLKLRTARIEGTASRLGQDGVVEGVS